MESQSRRSFLVTSAATLGGLFLWTPSAEHDVLIVEFSDTGARMRTLRVPKVAKSDDDWRRRLPPLAFEVTRRGEDEIPFSGAYWNFRDDGIYRCVCCDTAVFSSRAKFDPGTGWPSFWQPIAKENVLETSRRTSGAARTVVSCRRCDAFLGDLFDDGPQPTGLRYCINSASLRFVPAGDSARTLGAPPDSAVFAGGCFWGIQAVFEHVKGVLRATSGYAGGSAAAADYETVSSGSTGHAEAVRVLFDRTQVSYPQLLEVFFTVAHDPTQLNRQGPDVGPQYRSAIFYADDDQRRAAQAYVDELNASKKFLRPIVTQVVPLEGFFRAEEYHQDYAAHHPNDLYIVINDAPKVVRLKERFPSLYTRLPAPP